jgi:hypothetical protein
MDIRNGLFKTSAHPLSRKSASPRKKEMTGQLPGRAVVIAPHKTGVLIPVPRRQSENHHGKNNAQFQ